MLKRLWHILGPILIAFLLVVVTILNFSPKIKHNLRQEKEDAVALTNTSFKNGVLKRQALSDSKQYFVPFFGSSEWNRMDSMHPSVLAEKYHRSYRPFLIGKRGTANLSQFYGMQQINHELKNKKAVYVISPQWFTPQGTMPGAVQQYLSNSQLISFLLHADKGKVSRYAANRIMKVNPGVSYQSLLKKVANGQRLNSWDKLVLKFNYQLNLREESMFRHLGKSKNYELRIKPRVLGLPRQFSYDRLGQLATKRGAVATSNNRFHISNGFYKNRIAPELRRLRNFQANDNYVKSPEYNDLQLALSQLAKNNTNVMFIIPPVNDRWAKFTGLSQSRYQQAVAKIKYQLESQGFTNIADFSKDGGNPYFMQDTIHMGWNGWLAFDKAVQPFLETNQNKPQYHINNDFLSKTWANANYNTVQNCSKIKFAPTNGVLLNKKSLQTSFFLFN
ncbi:D-alanyl-lipoteichoic acid biosynthesis protein DltD [Streptococcus urinalis FB127-CNA-2]|uniref:D-alanyl-lipoteichoic acid biosynthesis protein DltD n=1 Tax=Streptococcus urinalis 2285-97 TaxID=764291 RepID=G5KHD7_9STRE|nr:D-alanyl-lipoteichoic acid biosynthesis protein DltD [Streptococcus urinalis]EHJ56774.1 D-alanyl-lipoteichoic acid biosynthesis protein DltD [Streptococcus urinalis 2285-97]EKS22496.1 D-alanyl-lipoteichoic acid biosynthesis protein DltD [Streptococcus urinalis FB127-CNA-2]VEF32309.1 Protein dltD [Streptococcus urinalis]